MSELTAARTLVKSPPELWAQCSDPESLARHLHAFGEITITRLDPERTVAWEGERASGTVQIEPAGWGTKVTLTAVAEAPPEPPAQSEVPSPPAPVIAQPRPAPRRGGMFGWLRGLWAGPAPEPAPEPVEPQSEPAAELPRPQDLFAGPAALDAALDSLGQAHHRPFSRS
jgi:hypothetical protein